MLRRPLLILHLLLLALTFSLAQAAQAHNGDKAAPNLPKRDTPLGPVPRAPDLTPKPMTLQLVPRFSNTTTTISTVHTQDSDPGVTLTSTAHTDGPDVTLTHTNTPTTPTTTPPVPPTSLPNADSPHRTDSGGLSTNTKIGVGVGVGVGLTALLLGGFAWLFFHRKSAAESSRRSGGSASPEGWRGWHTAF